MLPDSEPGSDERLQSEEEESSSFRPYRQQKQDLEPQIATHTYTLLRFSTCQILEENCEVSWYDIQPHELVELHSSLLPPTFAASLLSPMSIPSPLPDIAQSKFTQKKKPSPTQPTLAALSRDTPTSYIQPYWQGWVRVVSRIQTSDDPSSEDYDNGDWKRGERVEWKERWLVIHEGLINVCMSPNVRYFVFFFIHPTNSI